MNNTRCTCEFNIKSLEELCPFCFDSLRLPASEELLRLRQRELKWKNLNALINRYMGFYRVQERRAGKSFNTIEREIRALQKQLGCCPKILSETGEWVDG